VLRIAEEIARSHHERWDGEGYPDGLAGPEIPLSARLVGVADVFDVLVHERPYKDAWTVEDAAAEIRAGAGTQFDPDVIDAFDALGAGSWTAALD
jgi:putative two-component system response regulator